MEHEKTSTRPRLSDTIDKEVILRNGKCVSMIPTSDEYNDADLVYINPASITCNRLDIHFPVEKYSTSREQYYFDTKRPSYMKDLKVISFDSYTIMHTTICKYFNVCKNLLQVNFQYVYSEFLGEFLHHCKSVKYLYINTLVPNDYWNNMRDIGILKKYKFSKVCIENVDLRHSKCIVDALSQNRNISELIVGNTLIETKLSPNIIKTNLLDEKSNARCIIVSSLNNKTICKLIPCKNIIELIIDNIDKELDQRLIKKYMKNNIALSKIIISCDINLPYFMSRMFEQNKNIIMMATSSERIYNKLYYIDEKCTIHKDLCKHLINKYL